VKAARIGVLYADDSGGEGDALRSLAVLSGPSRSLLALERELRKVLSLYGVRELKWAGLRTKARKLHAAQACLDLLCVALGSRALRCSVLLWSPQQQATSYQQRTEAERLRPIYAHAFGLAAKRQPLRQWRAFPDQRTGMDWQRWSGARKLLWRQAGLARIQVREASSARSACVQLCDLIAGLSRQEAATRREAELPGHRAEHNRQALLNHWILAGAGRGLRLSFKGGVLHASQPSLRIQKLRRLPTLS
jgi:hypothetical protein